MIQGPFQISTDSVIFKDLNLGQTDFYEIRVKNIGNKPLCIRFSIPQNEYFNVSYKAQNFIVPGFDAKATIFCTAKSMKKASEKLIISCQDMKVEIPIFLFPPFSDIQISSNTIDIGNISSQSSQLNYFSLTNYGTLPGKFQISCTEDKTNINPCSGIINPEEKIQISFSYLPKKPGKFQFFITIEAENNFSKLSTITVTGNVVDQSVKFLFDGKETNSMDFGMIYFGQQKTLSFQLVNQGALKRTYLISVPINLEKISSPLTKSHSKTIIFEANKWKGIIEPFSTTSISFTFKPPPQDIEEDLEIIYSYRSMINVPDSNQIFDLNLIGIGCKNSYIISCTDFNFGEHEMESSTIKTFQLENCSKFLELPFEVKNIGHFRFSPDKGIIKPKECIPISISFIPKSIGPIEMSTSIAFCNGLFEKTLSFHGSGKMPPNGTKSHELNKTYQKATLKSKRTSKQSLSKKKDKEKNNHQKFKEKEEGINPAYGYNAEEILENKLKRKLFDEYLRENGEKIRNYKEKSMKKKLSAKRMTSYNSFELTHNDLSDYVNEVKTQFSESDDDENFTPFEGLKPYDPPLLTVHQPTHPRLTLREIKKSISSDKNKEIVFNDRNLIQKKFKPKPTTAIELKQCALKLSPEDQLNILQSHKEIDFGDITVFSVEKRSFELTNNLSTTILASISFHEPELQMSFPQSQVVPPGKKCGFDIILSSKIPKILKTNFCYSINEIHSFSVPITANFKPIEVIVSETSLDFSFTKETSYVYISKTISVKNISDSEAYFAWSSPCSAFSIHPSSGMIQPHKSINIVVQYHPDSSQYSEDNVTLSIQNGQSYNLHLTGKTLKSNIVLSKNHIDFGIIPLSVTKTAEIIIENEGPDDALFSVTPNLTDIMTICPANGKIQKNESIAISICVKCETSSLFDIPVTVFVPGNISPSFHITGQSVLPLIEMKTDDLNFGQLFIGNRKSKNISLKNISTLLTTVFLDLTDHPDFSLEYDPQMSKAININSETDKDNELSLLNQNSLEKINEPNLSSYSSTLIFSNKEIDNHGSNYRILIKPGETITFSLVCNLQKEGEIKFDLPIFLQNSTTMNEIKRPIVTINGIHSPLTISKNSIYFGHSTIYNSHNPNKRPRVKRLKITNNSDQSMKYRIELDQHTTVYETQEEEHPFSVNKHFGSLDVTESQNIIISFIPTRFAPYCHYLNIYGSVKNQEEILISKVQLVGFGSNKLIKATPYQIVLPPVPLGIESKKIVRILNEGSCTFNVKVECPLPKEKFPLSFTFPEGTKIESYTPSIPLQVSFCSQSPISFTTKVAIIDTISSTSIEIIVSASTDNSIFTLYPFLSTEFYQISLNEQLSLVPHSQFQVHKEDILSAIINSNISEIKKRSFNIWITSKNDLYFLSHFLNLFILPKRINNFPNDLINDDSSIIYETCTYLSSNHFSNYGRSRNTCKNNSEQNFDQKEAEAYNKMKKMLNFLTMKGANVTSIQPEFLLTKDSFIKLMREKFIKQLIGLDFLDSPDLSIFDQSTLNEVLLSQSFSTKLNSREKIIEEIYPSISKESWARLFLQIIKVFWIPKIFHQDFKQIPGAEDALSTCKQVCDNNTFEKLTSDENTNSNVFSNAESSILKWVSLHFIKENGNNSFFLKDFIQLANSKVILSLLHSYCFLGQIPEFSSNPPYNMNDEKTNCDIIERTLSNIGFPLKIEREDYTGHNRWIIALIYFQLFENLPSQIPSTTILFNCPMLSNSTQQISITNPSSNLLIYETNVKGSKNFILEKNEFSLNPSETLNISITYHSFTHKNEEAFLIFTPKTQISNLNYSHEKMQISEPSSRSSSARSKRKICGIKPQKSTYSLTSKKDVKPSIGSPIVIILKSHIIFSCPLKSFSINCPMYSVGSLSIPIYNENNESGKYIIKTKTFPYQESDTKTVMNNQMKSLFETIDQSESNTLNTSQIQDENEFLKATRDHQLFLIDRQTIELSDNQNELASKIKPSNGVYQLSQVLSTPFSFKKTVQNGCIGIEFVPIKMGSFRCLILFQKIISDNDEDQKESEFVYEIIGHSSLPEEEIYKGETLKMPCKSMNSFKLPILIHNEKLTSEMGYSKARLKNVDDHISENRFRELISTCAKEFQIIYSKSFQSQTFDLSLTSDQFFKTVSSIIFNRASFSGYVEINFNPNLPGEYPCKLIMKNEDEFDIRVIQFKCIGLASLRTLDIKIETSSGEPVSQDIPIQNTSDQEWTFNAQIKQLYSQNLLENHQGSTDFKISKIIFSVKPKSTFPLRLSFFQGNVGQYTAVLSVRNMTKEANTNYIITAKVNDPPAIKNLKFKIQARLPTEVKIEIPNFFSKYSTFSQVDQIEKANENNSNTDDTKNNLAKNYNHLYKESIELTIESDVPILECNDKVLLINNGINNKSCFSPTYLNAILFSMRSGLTAGMIKFTDEKTGAFMWYVVTVEVEAPEPEEVIQVKTIVQKPIVIEIPVRNMSTSNANFDIQVNCSDLKDNELTGKNSIQIDAQQTSIYIMNFMPTRELSTTANISFYSEDIGEYIYQLQLQVDPPEISKLAPLVANLGSSISTIITLENILYRPISYKALIGKEYLPESFSVNTKNNFTLAPRQKKTFKVTYTPSEIGVHETVEIRFSSTEVGDTVFTVTGIGKSPAIPSPLMIEGSIFQMTTSSVTFINPFPSSTKYSVFIHNINKEIYNINEQENPFELVYKKKTFTLLKKGDIQQIPFIFKPKKEKKYEAAIIVTSLTKTPITWQFPLIANTINGTEDLLEPIKGKAGQEIRTKYVLQLNGDKTMDFKQTLTKNYQYPIHSDNIEIKDEKSNILKKTTTNIRKTESNLDSILDKYKIEFQFAPEYTWLHSYLLLNSIKQINKTNFEKNNLDLNQEIEITLTFAPRKPIQTAVHMIVTNQLQQKWRFKFNLFIGRAKPKEINYIYSTINKAQTKRLVIKEKIKVKMHYEAYFTKESSPEITASPLEGFLDVSQEQETQLPIIVTYKPLEFGKAARSILIIETERIEYIFDIRGRIPDYIAPSGFKQGKIDCSNPTPQSIAPRRKRNFIKENIENVKNPKKKQKLKVISMHHHEITLNQE